MSAVVQTYDPETLKPVDKRLELTNLEYYDDHTSLLRHFVDAVEQAGWCSRNEIVEHLLMADMLLDEADVERARID